MKYYCKNCGSEVHILNDFRGYCHFCTSREPMTIIPDFEPVSQWEKRTGREYPDSAPVYQQQKPTGAANFVWMLVTFAKSKQQDIFEHPLIDTGAVVVATEAGAPPAGWRPE